MVVRDLRKGYLLVALPALLVVLVLVLTKLAAPIGAKAVEVATVGQRHRVRLPARNRHNLLVREGLYASRVRLVRFVLGVLREVADVVEA